MPNVGAALAVYLVKVVAAIDKTHDQFGGINLAQLPRRLSLRNNRISLFLCNRALLQP